MNKRYIHGLRIIIDVDATTQSKMIRLVDKMLTLNNRLNELGDKNTPETARLKEEIQNTDLEIDELVYELYDITDEEKKIIEGSLG